MIPNTFSHSGNLGDLIYSLAVVKKMGGGIFRVKLGNIPNVIRAYQNGPVYPEYENRLSTTEYNLIAPLLNSQLYIQKVEVYDSTKHISTVDLDEFRGVLHRSVHGNFLQAYYTTHKIPFEYNDTCEPWLKVKPNHNALQGRKHIITRTPRYRDPQGTEKWKQMVEQNDFANTALFIGLPSEHQDFEQTFGIKIPHYQCRDFLDMAEVIDAAEMFIGNQTFAYGIAVGLGQNTILETTKAYPLEHNECYFKRTGAYYF